MPFGLRRVEELGHGILYKGAPGFHRPGREIAMDDLAHLEMLGAIMLDELVRLVIPDVFVQLLVRFSNGRIGGAGVVPEDGVREQLMMPGHPHYIVMPGDDPQVVQLIPVDRVLFPEAAIIGIGIRHYVCGKHIIVHCHHRHSLSSSC